MLRPLSRLGLALCLGVVMTAVTALAGGGNGTPNGYHFSLNLIGMENSKDSMPEGLGGHAIFVKLSRSATVRTKILLFESEDFVVLDKNGTDGEASFGLPANNVDCPTDALPNDPCDAHGEQDYSVFVRGLGPNGSATVTTCTDDGAGGINCSLETITVESSNPKGKGGNKFDNVTKELTTLCLDTTGDGVCDTRAQLFADGNLQYYWDYLNSGLRLAQLRFYPIP